MEPSIGKKLTLSNSPMLAGVCAGIAEYFNLDPTVVRIIFVLFALCFGGGLLFYVVCYLLMPQAKSAGELRRERLKKGG